MIRPTPPSTLFPYTTLFRSLNPTQSGLTVPGGVVWMDGKTLVNSGVTNTIAIYTAAEIAFNTDRKSTRLNSSHPSISYAVFCLKKKIGIIQTMHEARQR